MTPKEMLNNIHWLGHDGFRIDAGKVVYIDPYGIEGGPEADLILVTHEHFNHCSPEDVGKVQGNQTTVITEKASAQKLKGHVRVMAPGESLDVAGVTVEAVPAYNLDKQFHPKGNGWLGFTVEIDGVRVYHAGDTDFIPEMETFNVDIALLPVSGTYVMTADEAVKAALAINPDIAVPMHYGAIVGAENDAATFQKGLEGKVEVVVLGKE